MNSGWKVKHLARKTSSWCLTCVKHHVMFKYKGTQSNNFIKEKGLKS